ncbi:class I SAM-dependent methyltransferase [Pseudonocardia sp. TMWB2A]|uniref:class I SAM-dependent methyltransferase n=1 Tax=Pseudonocardia sp. TMWB2A TaxID=687430 RepID=UPI00307D78A9
MDISSSSLPSTVQLEITPCPLGCAPGDKKILSGTDLLHDIPGEFTVVECQSCNLMRTDPRPDAQSIGVYYPSDYGPYVGTVVYADKQADGFVRKLIRAAKRIFDTKANSIPSLAPGKMLEFGSASGNYLHAMASQGWQVEGIEYSEDAASNARALGHIVHVGAIETITLPEQQFDLIAGWMVVEHLHDPVASLQKLARWAKPDATLAISVPNAKSAEFRLFGKRWYALQLPTHLYHYTPETLEKLLDRTGWTVTKIHHHRTVSNLVASLGYVLIDRGWSKAGTMLVNFPERGGRLGALVLFPLSFIMAALGQTGRMTVWAKRK